MITQQAAFEKFTKNLCPLIRHHHGKLFNSAFAEAFNWWENVDKNMTFDQQEIGFWMRVQGPCGTKEYYIGRNKDLAKKIIADCRKYGNTYSFHKDLAEQFDPDDLRTEPLDEFSFFDNREELDSDPEALINNEKYARSTPMGLIKWKLRKEFARRLENQDPIQLFREDLEARKGVSGGKMRRDMLNRIFLHAYGEEIANDREGWQELARIAFVFGCLHNKADQKRIASLKYMVRNKITITTKWLKEAKHRYETMGIVDWSKANPANEALPEFFKN